MAITCDLLPFGGWDRCLRLANGAIELVITLDVGPRILRCGVPGGQNLFHVDPADAGRTGGDAWRPYGGHRLWHAPEVHPRTFWPDNVPVAHAWDGAVLTVRQPVEGSTGIAKVLELRMDPAAARVAVNHRLENHGLWPVRLAPWALSVMAPGGRAIVPQEPFQPHAENCLPVRPLVLWSYTDMADPRFTWGRRFIQVRQDPAAESFQKIGMRNGRGWAAYVLDGTAFLKRYDVAPGAPHADHGCNTEIFTNAAMLELETLGPLADLAPGGHVDHLEVWSLHALDLGSDEGAIAAAFEPLLAG